ncbi:hypothetical protein RDI58_010723 [Solanum bulbocastanum]|uniref:Uncharacterized protein n=1 Tax=Solanum bulbocastanum TaxID=147425 RepID=A0AAN8TUD9_SOLBU
MNSMRGHFLWKANANRRKIQLIHWQVVLREKKGGGLGVRNLKLHNKSKLFKRIWRYNLGGTGAWNKLVNAIYGKNDGWKIPLIQRNVNGRVSKGVYGLWEEFIQYTDQEVGNGELIRFWTDIWVGEECLKTKLPNLFNCSIN